MVEQIVYRGNTLAVIVRNNFKTRGVKFFTPDDYSQQLAYMRHKKGKIIEPHVHNPIARQVHYTNEVLIIKKGKLRVDFYSQEKEYIVSRILKKGDVLLIVSGGHGFEVLKEVEMYEVKQGPYAGEGDKTRFIPKQNNP